MSSPPKTPPLSVALRALIDQRNILTSKSKSKVLIELDRHIESKNFELKQKTLKSKTVEELYATEESYLRNLEIAMKFFRNPIREMFHNAPNPLKILFDHLESVYNVNGELLNQLRLNGENVGAAFLKVAPFFKLYSVYATGYSSGVSCLQELSKTHSKLDSFIKKQETRPEVCSKLTSLLISPIQRIPRYRLLLKELLAHTSQHDSLYQSIQEALFEVEKATEHINKLVSDQESMKRMLELQRSLIGGKPELIYPGRWLFKEGILMKVSKTKDKASPRYFILTSDILVYCKMSGSKVCENSLRCSCVLPLRKTNVTPVLNDKLFSVSCGSITLILFSSEPYASENWVKAIRKAIVEQDECESTLKRRGSARLALLRNENNTSSTPSPRKRKLTQDCMQDVFHSPWKRSKVKKCDKEVIMESSEEEMAACDTPVFCIAGPSNEPAENKKKKYFGTLKKAVAGFSQALQRYWIPPALHKENISSRLRIKK